MHIKWSLLLSFALFYAGASQAVTYKWVDDSGRTVYGDTVPEKYRAVSETVEIKPNVIPSENLKMDPTDADGKVIVKDGAEIDNKRPAKVLEMSAPDNLPTSKLRAEDACELKIEQYRKAQECFVPYRNAQGAIDEEGVLRCPYVKPPECSPSVR